VITGDPNVASVELVAAALGELCEEVVLVGGCAASLLIDAPSAPPPRVTTDVDLIAGVTALRDYHALERRFTQRGLTRDLTPDAPICRWRAGAVAVDLMPTDESVLGFSNRWYAEAASSATRVLLPSGRPVNLISAPAFLGTKFEAFRARGHADMLMSHDFEDIINVLEGRSLVVEEIRRASPPLKHYLSVAFGQVMATPSFHDMLPGLVAYDELHEQRVSAVLLRIRAVAAM
jgi:predicted nucleotidyltransferase